MTLSIWIRIGTKVIGVCLKYVSPYLREALESFLTDQYKKAMTDDNPWNDHFYNLLFEILDIEKPVEG